MIAVHDDVLPDPMAYRRAALAQPFQDVDLGHAVFHGIAPCVDPTVAQWVEAHFPTLEVTLSFFRQSPAGQVEPNDIHTDVDMGDATVILYLNPDPPVEDGTTFWVHRATGAEETPNPFGGPPGKDRQAWVPYRTVPAVFNRAIVFPAPLFHSRALAENYGTGDGARLIQVLFAKART